MHRPLVGIALSYLTGIFLGFSLNISFRYIYPILFLFYLLILFFRGKKAPPVTTSLIYLSLFFLGMGAYSLKANPVYPNHIANFLRGEAARQVSLEGTIIKDPEVRANVALTGANVAIGEKQKLEERTILTLRAERVKEKKEWEKVVGLEPE